MTINEDGNVEIITGPGLAYAFAASGNFGGGSVSLEWLNELDIWTQYPDAFLEAAGIVEIRAISRHARIVVSNSADASIDVTVVRAQDTEGTAGTTIPRLFVELTEDKTLEEDTFDRIKFDTVITDTHSAWNTSAGVYVIPESGNYCITCPLYFFEAVAPGTLSIQAIAEVDSYVLAETPVPAGNVSLPGIADAVPLEAGDQIYIIALASAGGTVLGQAAPATSYLSIYKL